jgi:hypothetical protein
MNSIQLKSILECSPYFKNHVVGVFPSDMISTLHIDSRTKKPYAFVINNQPSSHPGEHWLAVYGKNNVCQFFDSYGRRPRSKYILKFLKNKRWRQSKKQVQSFYSDVCGTYCLIYLLFKCSGKNEEEFYELFNAKNKLRNDVLAYKLHDCLFSRYEKCTLYEKGNRNYNYKQCLQKCRSMECT